MRKIDALITSLRGCFGTDTITCDCENCMYKDLAKEMDYTECVDALGLAAADALEELDFKYHKALSDLVTEKELLP